jgi:phosphoribosylformylglycinamidine cyclo-ligase
MFEPNLAGMKRPVAISGTDGVGTKLKIAFLLDKHDTIGIDCVAMCVNDILCAGARPLFFLDYIATGKNKPERMERIVAGVADGCIQASCALVGGETAEHPGMMPEDEYDIAGFAVGFVDYDDIIDGTAARPGDIIIGLASSGLHSNGFSLVRKILSDQLTDLGRYAPVLGRTLGEELLQPTRIYVKPILDAIKRFGKGIKGLSHITGGGFYENIPRMLPQGVRAVIDAAKIPTPPIFDILAEKGGIPKRDMFGTFNMGVGFALCVGMSDADAVVSALSASGESPLIIGRCIGGDKGVELTW